MARTSGLEAIDKTVQKTHEWLKEIDREFGMEDKHFALQALRGVLHTLRDRLGVQESADLASQLPTLIRGIYFENWNPSAPTKDRRQEDFLAHIPAFLPPDKQLDPEKIARVVFRILEKHVSEGEMQHVIAVLPADLKELFHAPA